MPRPRPRRCAEIVPRILCRELGAKRRQDVISELYAAHAGGQGGARASTSRTRAERGQARGRARAGIVDALATKLSALRLACDAAITVLRVDTIIMSKQAGGPKPRSRARQTTIERRSVR